MGQKKTGYRAGPGSEPSAEAWVTINPQPKARALPAEAHQ